MRLTVVGFMLVIFILSAISQNKIQIDSTDLTLDEVVVTGTRNETNIRLLPMSVTVVSQKQIEQMHEQSLLPLLNEQVPGYFSTSRSVMGYGVANGSAGGMTIRGVGGSPTTGLLVLIDGHPQYMGLMGHPVADVYQSMLAEKVEVVRGPASVIYGSNAMGGVVNIVTRKLLNDTVLSNIQLSYGSFNTLTSEGANSVRKGGFSSVATASYNKSDGHRENMDFEQYGGYLKLGYDFSPVWSVYADANLTHFNASNPGTISAPINDNDSRVTRGVTSLSIDNNYSNTSGALKLFYNWGLHEINDGYFAGQQPKAYLYNSNDEMMGVSWYQSAALFKGNRITVGVDYQLFGGEAWSQFPSSRVDIVNTSEHEIAEYLDFRQTIGKRLTLDIGIRNDSHSQTGSEWIPQAGISVILPHSSNLKAMISKGFRNPTIRELYMFGPQNPNLLPEEMMNYELSFCQHLMDNNLIYGVNVFYIDGSNMIQTIYANGKPLNVNSGEIENWGAEANILYRFNSQLSSSANYSWLRMKYPVVAAPEHKLYADISYTKKRWILSTGVQFVNGLYKSLSPETKERFLLWNMRGSYRFSPLVELFIRGENLLNQDYEINAGYPMPGATIIGGVKFTI